jgi:hypothetical protein
VGLHENAVVPGILVAFIRDRFVVESKVPDDIRTRWIGSADCGPAMEKAIRLVEIGGLGHIRRDDRIILVDLSDAIHLNGEKHRDAILFQSTCQSDGLRATPTVPVKNDASILFLVGS